MDLAARRALQGVRDDERGVAAGARHDSPEHLAMVEGIRRRLGLTSLRYQTLPDMVEAIGLPKCDLCTYCWDRGASPS
jgi:amidophosphoribosyltransferase